MRGLLLAVSFFGTLPFVFRWPFLGILMWFWVSLMNPHKLVYGLFATLPYAMIVAIVTLIAWQMSREPKWPPRDRTAFLLCALMFWITVSSALGVAPAAAVWDRWQLAEKMFLFTVLAYALTNTRQRVDLLVAVCALSIGLVGVRGGLFTILHGGTNRVYGPDQSMIGDNNDFGVALVTMLPLLFYLFQRYREWYLKWPLLAIIGLNFLASLFTYSRGALVAITLMGATLWLRARWGQKVLLGILAAVAVVGVLKYAPPEWIDRMNTIQTYQSDQSAQGRLYYWQLSWAMFKHRPITGAGYDWDYYPATVNSILSDSGLPPLTRPRASHSIWFEMLSNHGIVGVGLFLALFVTGILNARWMVRHSRKEPSLLWANNLGRVLQASIIGFAAGGSFASLAMWDGFYVVLVMAAAARRVLAMQLAEAVPVIDASSAPDDRRGNDLLPQPDTAVANLPLG